MKDFLKNLLNYYAAFTETRFSNKSTLKYRWMDDVTFTLDITFFPEFRRLWLDKLSTGDAGPVEIRPRQYCIDLPVSTFKERLKEELRNGHNENKIKELISLEQALEPRPDPPPSEREVFLEGVRSFNLSLRKAIEGIIKDLQKSELDSLATKYQTRHFPPLSLNIRNFTQEIYHDLQGVTRNSETTADYFFKINEYFENRSYDLVLFDLYYLLTVYRAGDVYGTVYLFFDALGSGKESYPLFFLEVNFSADNADTISIKLPNDFILINTPAINAFDFDGVLTLPRATSLKECLGMLKQLDRFLDDEYQLSQQDVTLSDHFYHYAGRLENRPNIQFRLGFQVIREEDKRLLDYSELMTRIEKGLPSKISGFVDTYVHKNVINTTDDTDRTFRERYPRQTPRAFVTDNPLPLNEAQKKILLALANQQNRIIVIGGPPGTGKSHTITAMTYWANQNGRSCVITSHKQEALNVVDGMLTEKFRDLHPQAKPSIIRLTKTMDLSRIQSLNEITNALAPAAVDAATARVNAFPEEALKEDMEKIEGNLFRDIATRIDTVKGYPEMIKILFDYLTLAEELKEQGLITDDDLLKVRKPVTPLIQAFYNLEAFIKEFADHAAVFDKLSLEVLKNLFIKRMDLPGVIAACEIANRLSYAKDVPAIVTPDALPTLEAMKEILRRLSEAFDPEKPHTELCVSSPKAKKTKLTEGIATFEELYLIRERLKKLLGINEKRFFFLKNETFEEERKVIAADFPGFDAYCRTQKRSWPSIFEEVERTIAHIEALQQETDYQGEFLYRLHREAYDLQKLETAINDLKSLRFKPLLDRLSQIVGKMSASLTIKDMKSTLDALEAASRYHSSAEIIESFKIVTCLEDRDIPSLFSFLNAVAPLLEKIHPESLDALQSLQIHYDVIFGKIDIGFGNLRSLFRVDNLLTDEQKLYRLIKLHAQLSGQEPPLADMEENAREYHRNRQRLTEHANDQRLKNLLNHSGDVQRIKEAIAHGKRLSPDQAKLLLSSFACIIAEPDALFRFFPMEEDMIDILIFDEASQVSIAHSISLILRAKQVVVFGDEYQYGAVGAVPVSKRYSGGYFKQIMESYKREFNLPMTPEMESKIWEDETTEIPEDDQVIPTMIPVSAASQEWIRTFGIRNSTLNFCRAIANYSTTLTEHFRSFKEIIDYSNETFYKKAQILLTVNRLRTKPIDAVLRFIKVETQGKSGNNINLDELEAIQLDIETLTQDGFKGTIGVIASFRDQADRAEKYFRERLRDYPRLKEEQKMSVWFVGDVQGEERDIVYYSFVEDKKYGNANLRTIYPIPDGDADKKESLRMQRLNVGFSRAKDTMVFVHSMPLNDYNDTRLGDALSFYLDLLEETRKNDHFISDEKVFESPKEKELYQMLLQTDFYRRHREKIHIIPQFDLGKYIAQEYRKYIPRYRVDFLLTFLTEKGKEHSLILEYDGLEYHTKDPQVVKSLADFREEYLDYDIRRQLELESYGYRFLRINKFTLLPGAAGQTRVDILNGLLDQAFAS